MKDCLPHTILKAETQLQPRHAAQDRSHSCLLILKISPLQASKPQGQIFPACFYPGTNMLPALQKAQSLSHQANLFYSPSYTGQPVYWVTKPILVVCSALLHWQFPFKSPTFSLGFLFNFPKHFHHAIRRNFILNPPVFPLWCCIPTCRGWTGAFGRTTDPQKAGNLLSSRG